jgi:hypothetical protein
MPVRTDPGTVGAAAAPHKQTPDPAADRPESGSRPDQPAVGTACQVPGNANYST